jgi:ubiquinone/menaquinone biosynthesis C-methylase UbiE
MNRYFGLHTLEGEWHALLPRYILLAERLKGRRVLDIGCGSGIGASLLRELGAEMVDAIDHRPAVLEVARMKHAKDGLDFHVMFWEELDFPDDTFDVVICLDPSSPVTDPSLIQEVRRVLKAGGEYICAIERKTLGGMEALLPRYGYTDSAESVDINDAQERVPQLGELQKHFEKVRSIIQRPLLAYVFDVDADGDASRKEGDNAGVWTEGEGTDGDDNGRWLSVENGLSSKETDPGSVEIWFCGDSELPAPPLKEVRLPYYGITERLQQVVGDLQVRGMGDEDSLFEEVLDQPPTDELDERYDVSTFDEAQWEAQPTTIHQPVAPAAPAPPSSDVSQFQYELAELRNLYTSMHGDFQAMMAQAQNALAERDGYIQHLVQQVEMWQSRYRGNEPSDDSTTTGVYKKLEVPGSGNRERDALEAEVARLRDEQRRLAAELEEKNAFLRVNEDAEETSERVAPSAEELGLEESSISEVGEDSSAAEDDSDATDDGVADAPDADDAPQSDAPQSDAPQSDATDEESGDAPDDESDDLEDDGGEEE